MIEAIVQSTCGVVNYKNIKAHVTLELLEETSGVKFSVRLSKTRLDKAHVDEINGRSIVVGSSHFPSETLDDIRYISYDNRVIYPVYSK